MTARLCRVCGLALPEQTGRGRRRLAHTGTCTAKRNRSRDEARRWDRLAALLGRRTDLPGARDLPETDVAPDDLDAVRLASAGYHDALAPILDPYDADGRRIEREALSEARSAGLPRDARPTRTPAPWEPQRAHAAAHRAARERRDEILADSGERDANLTGPAVDAVVRCLDCPVLAHLGYRGTFTSASLLNLRAVAEDRRLQRTLRAVDDLMRH
ncbi:hypothetical protein GCM10028772_17250 [Nocardioides ultimimeridianus]